MSDEHTYPERERTKAKPFQFGDEKKESGSVVIPKGKGEELGDIPYVTAQLTKTSDESFLQLLHRLLYSTPGKRHSRKANIRKFCGFAGPWNLDDIKEKRLDKINQNNLRKLCKLLDCLPEGKDLDRDDLEDALAKFLLKPKGTGRKASTSTGKKSRKTKRAKKDENAPKRGMSAYMFFAKDKRESVLKKHPSLSVTEVAKKLGEKWRGLTSAEKKPYEKLAEAAKAKYEKEMKAYKKSSKSKKESSASDSGSSAEEADKGKKRKAKAKASDSE